MKLRLSAEESEVSYLAEFSEEELRLLQRTLNACYWNYIGEKEENICTGMMSRMAAMLPVKIETPKESTDE